MEITNEQLLQKIGQLVVLMDVHAEQYEQKIKTLEDTIKELSEKW